MHLPGWMLDPRVDDRFRHARILRLRTSCCKGLCLQPVLRKTGDGAPSGAPPFWGAKPSTDGGGLNERQAANFALDGKGVVTGDRCYDHAR